MPVVALALLSTFSQGSLTPPGAPAPTMKSLAQIEPRTPISSAPFTISNPGSYYLTTNVTVSSGDAITIAANNVTLDLKGFTIASTLSAALSDTAILLSGGVTNIAIYNGPNRVDGNHVTASGHTGIQVDAIYINNVAVRNTVSGNLANNYLGTVGNAASATSPWANISH